MSSTRKSLSSLEVAFKLAKAPQGPPDERVRPKPKPFPGRKTRPIAGQLDFEGREIPSP
jgi:hypothetical protein